jgi:hypothetical protein
MVLDVPAELPDLFGGGAGGRGLERPASQTWAKAVALGFLAGGVKPHILAKRVPRRARWAAVYARGDYTDKPPAVLAPVALLNRLPAAFGI